MTVRKRGFFIMSLGFINIVFSPVGGNLNNLRIGVLVTGIFLVAVGTWLYYHDRRQMARTAAKTKAQSKSGGSTE